MIQIERNRVYENQIAVKQPDIVFSIFVPMSCRYQQATHVGGNQNIWWPVVHGSERNMTVLERDQDTVLQSEQEN